VPSGEGNLQTFRDYVKTLPMNDSPDVFGLHANASITVQVRQCSYCFIMVLFFSIRLNRI
jgi:dynein heavy chain